MVWSENYWEHCQSMTSESYEEIMLGKGLLFLNALLEISVQEE